MNNEENLLYKEIEHHLLNDEKPSIYIKQVLSEGKLDKYPFSVIGDLKEVEQNPKYHPEGNVFIHTMMVVDEGAQVRDKSKNKRAYMWSLLLHDIGKKPTTKMRKGKLTSYNHDTVGKRMAVEFLENFNEEESFIEEVTSLIRWHMQSLFVIKDSSFKNVSEMLKDVDKDEIVLVSRADRLGRGNMNKSERNEVLNDIKKFKNVLEESK